MTVVRVGEQEHSSQRRCGVLPAKKSHGLLRYRPFEGLPADPGAVTAFDEAGWRSQHERH